MKKCVLFFAVIILLSACSSPPGNKTDATETSTGPYVCEQTIYSFVTLEEYNQFFSESEKLPEGIPDDFVKWEEVNYLGEYGKFSFTRFFEAYYYISGDIKISIDHNPKADPYYTPLEKYPLKMITADMTTMSKAPGGGESYFAVLRNGLHYVYSPTGNLHSIRWYENGTLFKISGGLHEYPATETETVIGKLLSVSNTEFNAAVAEIKRQLNTK